MTDPQPYPQQPPQFDPSLLDGARPMPITFGPDGLHAPAAPGAQTPPPPPPPDFATGMPAAAEAPAPGPHPTVGGPAPHPGTQPAGAPVAGAEEISAIIPEPDVIELTTGTRVRVRKMRTRETVALLNIGLAGIGPSITDLRLSADDPMPVLTAKFVGLILSALPHATDEAMAFLRVVCEPVALVRPEVDRAQKMRNKAAIEALDAELDNPDVLDTIAIIEAVATLNAGDMEAWGKRIAGALNFAKKTGQIPAFLTSPA